MHMTRLMQQLAEMFSYAKENIEHSAAMILMQNIRDELVSISGIQVEDAAIIVMRMKVECSIMLDADDEETREVLSTLAREIASLLYEMAKQMIPEESRSEEVMLSALYEIAPAMSFNASE